MKNTFLTIAITFFSFLSYGQNNIDELIDNYKKNDAIEVKKLGKLKLKVGRLFIDDDDYDPTIVKKMMKQIKEMYIVTTESDKMLKEMQDDVEEFAENNSYEKNMVVSSEGEEFNFYRKSKGNIITELFFFVDDGFESSLITLQGKINSRDAVTLLDIFN
ncbi:MAG: DUF4252 domain-containing protein [Bacteroidota bacterium]